MKLAFPCTFAIGSLLAAFAAASTAHASTVGATPDACSPAAPMPKAYVGAGGDCDYHDIQSAINAAGACGLAINITPETVWTNQTIEVHGNKNVTLIGWGSGETCNHLKTCNLSGCTFNQNPRLPITPASGHSGLYVDGSNNTIRLDNLEFHGASLGTDHGGGGIAFNGSGSLTLDTVTLDGNTAGWGGGLWFNGSGTLTFAQNVIVSLNHASNGQGGGVNVSTTGADPIAFTIGTYSSVQNNTASADGGGIFIQHNVHLVATAPGIWIYHNTALNADGGGLYVGGAAQADIGSPGIPGLTPVIDTNYAAYGGGIAAAAFNGEAPQVTLFTTDPAHPVQVAGNSASHTGGGVYLRPLVAGISGYVPTLCAYDFRIDGNSAQEGSAIYGDEDHSDFAGWWGSAIGFNTYGGDLCPAESAVTALGAVRCGPGVTCNELDDNIAQTSDGTATAGATILLQSNPYAFLDRFGMRANHGGKAIRMLTDQNPGIVDIRDCLLADNAVTENLIEATPGGGANDEMNLVGCTFANNTIGASAVILAQFGEGGVFTLSNSIIHQPGHTHMSYSGPSGGLAVAYDLSDDGSLTGTDILHNIPSFVDAAHGDYHLLPTSLGVDYAPAGSTRLDLDGHTRVVDLPAAPNWFGPMDLGAYEIQLACSVADTIFCDGFDG